MMTASSDSSAADRQSLVDRVAIVTGAGKGLGQAYALELAARGAAVVVNNRRHEGERDEDTSAFKTVAAIRSAGGRAVASYHAVEAEDSGRGMVELALAEFGRLDIVVANAAVPQASSFHRLDLAQFRHVFDVSFLGTLNLLHAAWPVMRRQEYGRIITTSSSAGRYGQHGLSAYGAAKAAVENLTRTLAAEGARHGIRANAISPYAHSQMTQSYMRPDIAAAFRPERVAPMVAWLASEGCSINGQVIVAGGGRYRRAFAVETSSVTGESRPLVEVMRELEAMPGVAFATSNAAFDALLVESGLSPRAPV